jgi:hypothetical protein
MAMQRSTLAKNRKARSKNSAINQTQNGKEVIPMTKIVWLAIALMLLAGTTIITAAYACGSKECKGHSEGECSEHVACEGHSEGECSGHDESEEHAKDKCHMAGMMKNLSDEQCAAVHAKIKAMKAEGATYEQIHIAVKEMVEGNSEAKAQASEVKPVTSSDAHKENCSGRNWITKTVFAVGHAFKTVAGAVVGIFS